MKQITCRNEIFEEGQIIPVQKYRDWSGGVIRVIKLLKKYEEPMIVECWIAEELSSGRHMTWQPFTIFAVDKIYN